jgi:hypothetical protein
MRKMKRSFLITVFAVLFAASVVTAQDNSSSAPASGTDQPQVAQPQEGGVNWKGVGVGAGTVAGNIVYVPLKLAYGILGGIAGGAGYALTGGNKQVADTIWRSSLGGDYVLTPDMIKGEKPIYFSGPNATAPASESSSGDPAAANSPAATQAASSSPSSTGAEASASVLPTRPIDNGAGPVGRVTTTPLADPVGGSGSTTSSSSSSRNVMPTFKAAPLPDTSIE